MTTKQTLGFTAGQTLRELDFYTKSGDRVMLDLCQPITLLEGFYSPYTICRLCVSRLSLRAFEKVLLYFILDEAESDLLQARSYAEIGTCVCKSAHSAEIAMGVLRKTGLVMTARAGREAAKVAIDCDVFVRWAEHLLDFSTTSAQSSTVKEPSPSPDSQTVSPQIPSTQKPVKKRSRTRPKSPDVSLPVPSSPEAPAASPALSDDELERLLKEERARELAQFTQADGTLYPGVYLDAEGHPHFDAASGAPVPPCLQTKLDDEVVDPTGEINATRAAAGRLTEDDSDEDEISFGSETAETDMNPNVQINPDI